MWVLRNVGEKRRQKEDGAESNNNSFWVSTLLGNFKKSFARMNRSRAYRSLCGRCSWVHFPGGRLAQGPGEDRLIYSRPGARDAPGAPTSSRLLWVVQDTRFLPPPLLSAALGGSTSGHGHSPARRLLGPCSAQSWTFTGSRVMGEADDPCGCVSSAQRACLKRGGQEFTGVQNGKATREHSQHRLPAPGWEVLGPAACWGCRAGPLGAHPSPPPTPPTSYSPRDQERAQLCGFLLLRAPRAVPRLRPEHRAHGS